MILRMRRFKEMLMTTRRTFLTQAGLISAGALLTPHMLKAAAVPKPGLQLYSLRDQLPADVKGVIAKVGKAGYKEAETFGYSLEKGFWGTSAKDFGAYLKDNGITTPSGHYGISYFGDGKTDDLKGYIETAKTLNQSYLVIPSIDGRLLNTADKCKAVAEKMNRVSEICRASGLKLGYHNHNFEWKPLQGGSTFYEILLKETDPKTLRLEMDIFWVVRAGQDPVKIFADHPGRFDLVHIKDRNKTQTDLNTEIGKGSIDYKAIIPKAKAAGVKHFIVEQENFINIDPYVSITESCNYMKNTLHV